MRQTGVLVAVVVVFVTPWCIRNQIIFGEFFYCRFTGRTLWITCHVERPGQVPVPFADGPKTRAPSAVLEGTGITLQSATWEVHSALRGRCYPDNEVDKLMEGAIVEGILAHPWQYLAGRPVRFIWFWVTPKGWVGNMPWGGFYSNRDLPAGWSAPFEHRDLYPPGQVQWSVPFLEAANTAFLRAVWHPNSYLFALAALVAAASCLFMIWQPATREAGLAVASVLLIISIGTSCFTWPEYRFRMPLEPAMIVAVVAAAIAIWDCLAARIARGRKRMV